MPFLADRRLTGGCSLTIVLAMLACTGEPSSPPPTAVAAVVDANRDCVQGCTLVASTAPLAGALSKPDSADAELFLAQLRLQSSDEDALWLQVVTDDSVIAAAGPDVALVISTDDAPERRQRIPLADLRNETNIRRLVGDADNLTISLESRVRRAIKGRFEIQLRTSAMVDVQAAPWSTTARRLAFLQGPQCDLTTQTGNCDAIDWSIVPFAPGSPFGDFQSQPGTGVSSPITIAFSGPVASASVTAEDPTFAGNQVAAFLEGVEVSRQDFAFSGRPGRNRPDTQLVSGPFDRLDLIPAPAEYVAYTVSISTAVADRCEVSVTPLAQSDPSWASEIYDHTSRTISRKGCALTSLAMALTFAGHLVNPSELNAFMIGDSGAFDDQSVNWEPATRDFSLGVSEFVQIRPRDDNREKLAVAVCTGSPVIVWVPSQVNPGGPHFVTVTGAPRGATSATPLNEFSIVDPADGSVATLARYGTFGLRGFLRAVTPLPRPNNFPTPTLLAASAVAQELSLTFVAGGGTLLVTDPQGRRLGQAAPLGPTYGEIPNSYFDENENPADETGAADSIGQLARAGLADAIGGIYHVTVIATITRPDGLFRVRAETPAGPYRSTALSRAFVEGTSYQFEVTYDPAASTAPAIVPVLAAWAPGVSYQLDAEASFNGLDYRARQSHTSQVGWEPPQVYALWARINAGDTWAPQVLYETGNEVIHQGIRYRALQSHQSLPTWQPPNVPALWAVVP